MAGSTQGDLRAAWKFALKNGGRFRPTVVKRHKRPPWIQPWDMPDRQAAEVAAGRQCGSPKAHAPGYCRSAPIGDGQIPRRCKRHGGDGSGAPIGNANAATHGMYRSGMTAEEWEIFQNLDAMDLSQEIKITKVRLRRAIALELAQQLLLESSDADDREQALVLHERVRTMSAKEGLTLKAVRRTTDYGRAVHRMVGQLAKLHARQVDAERAGQELPLSAQEVAAAMRDAVAEMHGSMNQ